MPDITKLPAYLHHSIQEHGAQYTVFGLFGLVMFPSYYWVWLDIAPQPYENLLLRLGCATLCLLLVCHKWWPTALKSFLPCYWYVTLLITLPLFFVFMLIMNHGLASWPSNTIASVFFMLLLVDTNIAIVLLAVGSLLGGILAILLSPHIFLVPTFDYNGFFITYLIAIVIGSLFSHNRQRFEQLKRECIQREAECAEKAEFIANMSHDLRTPLTGILSVAEHHAQTLESAHPLHATFCLMHNASKQLHRLFESLLFASKLNHADTDTPTAFVVEKLITNVITLFQPALTDKGLTCHKYPLVIEHDKSPLCVVGHPHLIERILMNLLSNAIKYTDQGRITIRYELVELHHDAPQLKIAVQDSGIGIEKTDQSRIFQSFRRLTSAYHQNRDSGTGMGLYITKKLLALMNGTVTVDSQGREQGSTFTCLIPVTDVDEPLSPDNATQKHETLHESAHYQPLYRRKSESALRVLLVEDVSFVRTITCNILKKTLPYCQIDEAETAEQAMALSGRYRYDLILMDIGLSADADGISATNRIREKHKGSQNANTPIIAVISHAGDKESVKACHEAGINAVYAKPFSQQIAK